MATVALCSAIGGGAGHMVDKMMFYERGMFTWIFGLVGGVYVASKMYGDTKGARLDHTNATLKKCREMPPEGDKDKIIADLKRTFIGSCTPLVDAFLSVSEARNNIQD